MICAKVQNRPISSFLISLVPPQMHCTRESRQRRIGDWSCRWGLAIANCVVQCKTLALLEVILQYHFMRTELVTTLKRQATELLSEVEREKQPILITQHGVPSAYLVDVETYEALQQRMSLLEGIARGEKAIEEGRTLSNAEAKKRMARWLK